MLTLDFINVGYGDAILIRDTGAAFSMLVDCGDITVGDGGPESKRISAAEFLRREGIHTLDLLVLTHLHRDHSGGLTELLRTVNVREFWCSYLPPHEHWGGRVRVEKGFSAGSRCLLESLNIYLLALKTLEAQNTAIRLIEQSLPSAGLTASLGTEVYLEDRELFRRQSEIWQSVLEGNPSDKELDELDHFINNTSIRLRLICKETAVELPGDMYADCWEKHEIPPCTLVKLPHHGHRDSITPHLLDMLAPKTVVISVSNTRTDDCPAASVLQMVREKGCALYVTDAIPDSNGHVSNHPAIHFDI